MGQKVSLTEAAYLWARAELLACRLAPGEPLSIKNMASDAGVSLGAMREALARLTAEGFVIADLSRGFRAAPISVDDLHDLTRIRATIESMCLQSAIEHGDLHWEVSIIAAGRRVSHTPRRDANNPQRLSDAYAAVHRDLHEALVAACDSPWLLRVRKMLYAQSDRYFYIPLAPQDEREVEVEHTQLVEATIKRDSQRAVELLTRHLHGTARRLLATDMLSMSALPRENTSYPPRINHVVRLGRIAAG